MDSVKPMIGLVRDNASKALINTDLSGYHEIVRERQRSNEINKIKTDVETIKMELSNVKSLLNEITILVKRY